MSRFLESAIRFDDDELTAEITFEPSQAALKRLISLPNAIARVAYRPGPLPPFDPRFDPRNNICLLAFEAGELDVLEAEVRFNRSKVWYRLDTDHVSEPHPPLARWSKIRPGRPWEIR